MDLTAIWNVITKIIDIVIIWIAFYYILKNVKNNIKMVLIVKGVIIILIVKIISDLLNLYTVGVILEYLVAWGPLALIVIFQPEIRSVLESLGRTQLLGRHKILTVDEREKLVYEVVNAAETLRKSRIGALIVFERDNSLSEYIEKSHKIYADISSELLVTLFFPNNPLHDGGVILQGDKISCAGAVFPTSDNIKISKRLGTRHRAALGIAEETDCISLVVSEETGRLSLAFGGELHYNLTLDEIKMMLLEELRPKKSLFVEEEDADEKNN